MTIFIAGSPEQVSVGDVDQLEYFDFDTIMLLSVPGENMARRSLEDLSTLQMALVGYEIERQKIEARIHEIQAKLKGKHVTAPSAAAEKKPVAKRILSAEARKRIAAAQKKRWAEHRKRMAAAKES